MPINSAALCALLELRKRGDGTERVIRNAKGLPLSDPLHWFETAVRMAKIRGFSWHCLRHTFASRLVMAGVIKTSTITADQSRDGSAQVH
jgi:integrase